MFEIPCMSTEDNLQKEVKEMQETTKSDLPMLTKNYSLGITQMKKHMSFYCAPHHCARLQRKPRSTTKEHM